MPGRAGGGGTNDDNGDDGDGNDAGGDSGDDDDDSAAAVAVAEAEVEAGETALLEGLRIAGLKRGQENTLIEEVWAKA